MPPSCGRGGGARRSGQHSGAGSGEVEDAVDLLLFGLRVGGGGLRADLEPISDLKAISRRSHGDLERISGRCHGAVSCWGRGGREGRAARAARGARCVAEARDTEAMGGWVSWGG